MLTPWNTYFGGKHLKELRLRTFFKVFASEDPETFENIQSEGSYAIEIVNSGAKEVIVKSSDGGEWRLIAGRSFPLVLPGSPEMVRDDILTIEFVDSPGFGDWEVQLAFHRVVKRREDEMYPVNEYKDDST